MLDYNVYLENILIAIKKIEASVKERKDLDKEDIWDATLMRLQIIGENSRDIPKEIKKRWKKFNWRGVLNLRNIISHKYQKVDKELIWKFIEDKLYLLKEIVEEEIK